MGLEDPHLFTGHSLRRTSATILADRGASGTTIRNKLNQKSEQAVNEYISSSKSVQKTNAHMLAGYQDIPPLPKSSETQDPRQEVSMNLPADFAKFSFENCQVNFNMST